MPKKIELIIFIQTSMTELGTYNEKGLIEGLLATPRQCWDAHWMLLSLFFVVEDLLDVALEAEGGTAFFY